MNLTGVDKVIKWPCDYFCYATYWIRKTFVYPIIYGYDELGSSYYAKCFQYFFIFIDKEMEF